MQRPTNPPNWPRIIEEKGIGINFGTTQKTETMEKKTHYLKK